MWMMKYEGRREDSSFRHPEELVEMAPQHLQEACRIYGGVNHRGEPNFRIVRVASRFMIAGGEEFHFYDTHGNYQKACPAEMLIPRYGYAATEPEYGLWLLERWHPPEWYYEHNFAGRADDVAYTPDGKATRCVEPIWPEGGYEACWYDLQILQMLVLPIGVSIDAEGLSVAWAIQAVLWAERIAKMNQQEKALEAIQAKEQKERDKTFDENVDSFKDGGHPRLFLEPAVSYSGLNAKEEVWQQNKESYALEPTVP